MIDRPPRTVSDGRSGRQPSRVRAWVAGVLLAVLAGSACTNADATADLDGRAGDPPAAAAHGTPAGPPAAQAAPEAALRDAAVAVTSTGVPVAVLEHTDRGTLVRSPCGNEVPVGTVHPLGAVAVVLDAGHGGPADLGAIGANGLREADLNLTVSRAVEEELTARGISTVLTRTGDYAVPLSVRAAFADASGAQLFVSIHHNAPKSAHSHVPGTEVFVQSTSPASARLGGLLYEEVMRALSGFDIAWTRRTDAGVLRVLREDGTDAYGLIRRPRAPTALVELGYLANPAEAALFATPEYVTAASTAIAGAIESYLTSDRQGSGHVATPRRMTPGRSPAGHECTDPALE